MRGILGGRRTFAAALVIVVLVSVVIGALRDDEDDDAVGRLLVEHAVEPGLTGRVAHRWRIAGR